MFIRIGQRPDHGFDEPLGLLSDCHRRIEHFVQLLETTAGRSTGESLSPAERQDLEASIAYFAQAAPRHTADEEESLFPRLRASNDPEVRQALATIERLEGDHRAADAHHAEVDRLVRSWLSDGTLPPAQLADLREHLGALREIYEPHIAIEDRDLFPAASRLLTKDEQLAIGREMARRRSLGPSRS